MQVRLPPVRVTRVADVTDQLAPAHGLTGRQARRVSDSVPAGAEVVVRRGQVVVQVDVDVRHPGGAMEVEHAIARESPEVLLDLARLERDCGLMAERHDVDPLVRALRTRRAEVVREGDVPDHRKRDHGRDGGRLRGPCEHPNQK